MENKIISEQEVKFGLPTAIAMIVGIVIGSGIFFKADSLYVITNGNILLGCMFWLLGALGIIFGGLTIAEWAKRLDTVGGLISYSEMAFGKTFGFLAGWFQTIIYLPALCAIIAFVCGLYITQLFGLNDIKWIWIFTIFSVIFIFSLNVFATKLAALFQTTTVIIKLIPLIIFAIVGIIFGNPSTVFIEGVSLPLLFATSSGIVAVAFSYDGWLVAPSITHEIKNAKRNLSLALTLAPLFIMVIYIAYYVGVSIVVGPEFIQSVIDGTSTMPTVYKAAQILFGSNGAKLILIAVVLSIFGVLNGLVLGYTRMPYALALRKELPFSETIAKVDKRFDMPLYSSMITIIITLIWLVIHYLSTVILSLSTLDISSLPIIMTYFFYILLYVGIIKLFISKQIKNILTGLVFPLLAITGALIVIYGGFTMPNFEIYLLVSFISVGAGLLIIPKKSV
ncbi:MAG: APC family permease [Erysipelotrichaceae bacterium]|nr:APC family permease [Erysipelotrichaceae bacterium]MDD3923979.1 APC family permease [Erysipelotrichaceae bacterium]MDD4643008.1 APC family permease [Erysipelotrichaceae bacterium]